MLLMGTSSRKDMASSDAEFPCNMTYIHGDSGDEWKIKTRCYQAVISLMDETIQIEKKAEDRQAKEEMFHLIIPCILPYAIIHV